MNVNEMKENELNRQKLDYMCLQREMNSFRYESEERKEKSNYIIQFRSKETKRARGTSQE